MTTAPSSTTPSRWQPHSDPDSGPTLAGTWLAASNTAISDALLEWPADLFALTNVILERAQVFRFVLSPPAGEQWPPISTEGWSEQVREAAHAWSAAVDEPGQPLPAELTDEWHRLVDGLDTPLEHLARGENWRLCESLLTLHAISDEACAVLFGATDGSGGHAYLYRAQCRELLARTGSLSRVDPRKLRVLPKVRTPPTGRASFSRYVCVVPGGFDVRWHNLPYRSPGAGAETEHLHALLLPWPLRVRESDFRSVEGSVRRPGNHPFGFFEFAPSEPLDLGLVDRVLAGAREEVNSVDFVVMPESAIDVSEVAPLEALLHRHGVVGLRAGVRERSDQPGGFSRNWVHIGVNARFDQGAPIPGDDAHAWLHLRQNKHHRWSLDEAQIYQYHLGGALHPHVRWFEAMDVPALSVQFVQAGWGSTMAHVVCEDLTQNDEMASVIRTVGPNLVIAYLLDGPQLASRWSARYASVLADDPGSAVLTVSSYGMVRRSRPHGRDASPVIGLWKDPDGGTREIPLEAGAHGVVLTICGDRAIRRSADGRLPADTGVSVFDVAINQVRAAHTGSGAAIGDAAPVVGPALDVDDITILTGWAEAITEAAAYAPDKALALLAQARTGAAWRDALGIAQPSVELQRALDAVTAAVTAAAPGDQSPTFEAILDATGESPSDEPAVEKLARRVLRSTLDQLRSREPILRHRPGAQR
jgi:hypothetical protein